MASEAKDRLCTRFGEILADVAPDSANGLADTVIRYLEWKQAAALTFALRTFLQYLSDHWPPGMEWPPDIPRPEPSSDSQLEQGEVA